MFKNRRVADMVDSLIPHSIWRSMPDAVTIARARTLVCVLVFSIVVPVIALVMVMALHFSTQRDFTPAIVSLVAVVIVLITQHLLLQASANLYVTGVAYSCTFYVLLVAATAVTGGWNSPVVTLLFCTPVMVFLISGWREAEVAVLLTFATGMVLMLLEVAQVPLPYLMHAENRPYAQGVVWFMACFILAMLFGTQKWVHGLDVDSNIGRDDMRSPD